MDANRRFRLKCQHCPYIRYSTGQTTDLADLYPIKKAAGYAGPRLYRCPGCGHVVKLIRMPVSDGA